MDFLPGVPKSRLIIIGIVVLIVTVVVFIFLEPKAAVEDPNLPQTASLTVWGLAEDKNAFDGLIKTYQASYETVKEYKISFVPFETPAELESRLVNSLAENTGPDIFYFHNSWTLKHRGKVQPAYSQLFSPAEVSKLFPQAVTDDFMDATGTKTNVYALPLSMDALGLIYNKDIIQASGIVLDAKTWEALSWNDFIGISQAAKRVENENISRAGTALGTAQNISNFGDIVSALLLQSQAPFAKTDGSVSFDDSAKNAFLFYLQFADRASNNYTWNNSFGNSREEFAKNNVAAIVDYHSALSDIRKRNQFIDMQIVPLPQLSGDAVKKRTLASYWGLAVSNFSKQKYAAWHFIRFVSLNEVANSAYLEKTGKLPALISLINKKTGGEEGAFVKSMLFGRMWRQKDPGLTNIAFGSLLDLVNSKRLTIDKAIYSAQETLNFAR